MASAPNPQPVLRPTSHKAPVPARFIRNPLQLWHLFSLDAPTVAGLWTYFIAAANNVHVPWTSIAAMATAVWLLYAGDRLLDARILMDSSGEIAGMEARHRFHHRHRHYFRLGIAAASLLLAALLPTLPSEAIHLYLIEGSFLAGYFLFIHAAPTPFRLPKELAVGLLFAAAVFIPTVARAPILRLPLLAPAALFAALCTFNCLSIYAWEHPTQTHPAAHLTTRFALRHLRTLSLALLLAALTLTFISGSAIPAAMALSTAALLTLHSVRGSLAPTALRAAADLALLTPIFFLPFA